MSRFPKLTRAKRPFVLAAILVATFAAFDRYQASQERVFAINLTDSLTNWAFMVDRKGAPKRGDLVLFHAPDNPYYQGQRFVKRIAGASGDLVERRGRQFFVNGEPVCTAKAVSRQGDTLAPGPTGIIPPGHFFVFANHKDSYDSRYKDIGWISQDRIIGIVTRTIL